MNRRNPRRRIVRRAVGWVCLGIILCVGLVCTRLYQRHGTAGDTVVLEVTKGLGSRGLVTQLSRLGLVNDPALAYWFFRFKGVHETLRAGSYHLSSDDNLVGLAETFSRPDKVSYPTVTIIPGDTVWRGGAQLGRALPGTLERWLAHVSDHRYAADTMGLPVGVERPSRPDGVRATYLEGFLYPDTYHLATDASVDGLIRRSVSRFKEVWGALKSTHAAAYTDLRRRYGLSELELVTLASLVEREVTRSDERSRVAGVFYNRLDRGMRLQTDPTLMYHPLREGVKPHVSHRRDGSNPYNTYTNDGLPPGPIGAPERASLESVLMPERHELLYFVAMRDGSGRHDFSRTLDEHEEKIRRHLKRP